MEPEQPREVIWYSLLFLGPIFLAVIVLLLLPTLGYFLGQEKETQVSAFLRPLIITWGSLGLLVAMIGAPIYYGQEGFLVTVAATLGLGLGYVLVSVMRWVVSRT
jgi:hypothetical protein